MQKALKLAGLVALAVVAAPAGASVVSVPKGSGTVNFELLAFNGPVTGIVYGPGFSYSRGLVNGVYPTLTGQVESTSPGSNRAYELGTVRFASGTTSVSFGFDSLDSSNVNYNKISFLPKNFKDKEVGEDFSFGTITFQNGGWYGAGDFPQYNVLSQIPFRVWTESLDGPQFNQQRYGIITMTVNVIPVEADPNLEVNQRAEADYIVVYMGDDPTDPSSWDQVADFRVLDLCCGPPGATNLGTVELMGKFGSLILTGLADPQGGFIAGTSDPLPVVLPGGGGGGGGGGTPAIPEPAAWAMMIAGFGLVGGMMRRRREAVAA